MDCIHNATQSNAEVFEKLFVTKLQYFLGADSVLF